MAIENFRRLFSGSTMTKEMFEECQLVNSIFADVATQITEREEQLRLEYNNAQALWEAVRRSEDRGQRKSAVIARHKAQAALWEYEQESKDQFSSLALFMHYWAEGKEENRRGWAQTMSTIVTNGRGSGAALSKRLLSKSLMLSLSRPGKRVSRCAAEDRERLPSLRRSATGPSH